MERKERIGKIIAHLQTGLFEREEHVAVLLLAALAGQNAFLLGPPGTAKSLLARRISQAFDGGTESGYFEYLMNRFSTPEEVFGPVSIKALKDDRYERKTEGYLPTARFAFLDEIWKSSPAILNSLLTIINEKRYHNGGKAEEVPLMSLIAASNETPQEGQGLEALYDRFVVRMHAAPITNACFDTFLASESAEAEQGKMADGLAIKPKDLEQWRREIDQVKISRETIKIVNKIRYELEQAQKQAKQNPDAAAPSKVSDRRWLAVARFMKAAAFFCGRKETILSDALLMRHCLWTTEENRDEVVDIVEKMVRESGLDIGMNTDYKESEIISLEKEISAHLRRGEDEYDVKIIRGKEYYHIRLFWRKYVNLDNESEIDLLLEKRKMMTKQNFNPVDLNGDTNTEFQCIFIGMKICEISDYRGGGLRVDQRAKWAKSITVSPVVLHAQGSYKGAPENVLAMYEDKVDGFLVQLKKMSEDLGREMAKFEKEIATPFVPDDKLQIAMEGVQKQAKEIERLKFECERIRKGIRGPN